MSKSPGWSAGPPGPGALPVGADDYRRLFQELQVHQVELAQQNEALQQARSALGASLRRYVDLYDHAPAGLVTVDANGTVLELNRRAHALLGGAADSLVGRSLPGCLGAGSRRALAQAMALPLGADDSHRIELTVTDGAAAPRILQAELRAGPRGDDSLLLALTDITAQQQAHAELVRTREILELSNRVARIGWWAYDVAGGTLTWSAVAREIHGVDSDDAPTLDAAVAFFRAGNDADRLHDALAAAIGQGRGFDLELQLTPRHGAPRWVRKIGLAEMYDGRCQRLYGTFQDIDTRVRAEQARLAQARAEAANRSKSALLARVSHELRTPLNAVLGFSYLLQWADEVQASPRSLAQVKRIHEAGQHLLAMVDDILDVSRIESGALALEAVELGPLLDDGLHQVAAAAARRRLHVGSAGAPAGLQVMADRRRLAQVLGHLLDNAVKYNQDGGELEITVAADEHEATVAVRDTGCGLDAQQLAGLFQPFDRLGAEARGVEGRGLGLALAQQLALAMGGRLDATSAPGVGSVFTLRLPRAVEPPAR